MDKSLLGLAAALVAAPLTVAHATAVTPEDAANALRVSSVADLLESVPNSAAVLAALNAEPAAEAAPADKGVQLAQWHHHHHHHHHFYHHHHHHHHWYWRHHHHHHWWHHHHHHHYW
jgi:hypothetical protein